MRRRLREAARFTDGIGGYDIIVVAKAGAVSAQFAELEAALGKQLAVFLQRGAEQ